MFDVLPERERDPRGAAIQISSGYGPLITHRKRTVLVKWASYNRKYTVYKKREAMT